jgi:large subunit ribosomal protein L23
MALFNTKKPNTPAPVVSADNSQNSSADSMADLYVDKKVAKTGPVKNEMAYRVLVRPMVTEKAANLGTHNQYVFQVALNANKISVAKAIKEVYGISPVAVNIIKMKGKKVSRGQIRGQRSDFKKAIVSLPKGQTINIYEGV